MHEAQTPRGPSGLAGAFAEVGDTLNKVAIAAGVIAKPPQKFDFSEIEKQIYIQFLTGEIQYLKANRLLSPAQLSNHVGQDMRACKDSQAKISGLLAKLLSLNGVAAEYPPLLERQRKLADAARKAMAGQEAGDHFTATFDSFLNKAETAVVRKILEAELRAVDGVNAYDSGMAWTRLEASWKAFFGTQKARVELPARALDLRGRRQEPSGRKSAPIGRGPRLLRCALRQTRQRSAEPVHLLAGRLGHTHDQALISTP